MSEDVRPWDLFLKNKTKVSDEEKNNRLNICLSCPELIKITKQ